VNDGTRWLTTEDAARYAGYHRPKSFLEWARVHKVPRGKAGRSNRWLREHMEFFRGCLFGVSLAIGIWGGLAAGIYVLVLAR
jgi:hypothetical protein